MLRRLWDKINNSPVLSGLLLGLIIALPLIVSTICSYLHR
jgi:hypothetical protein